MRRVSALVAGVMVSAAIGVAMPAAASADGFPQVAATPMAVIGTPYSYRLENVAGSPATSATGLEYGGSNYDAPCPSSGYVGGLPSGLTLDSTGLITGKAEFPEQTQFCDVLTFADGSSGDAIVTMSAGTGNASVDATAIPSVSLVVSALQNVDQGTLGIVGIVGYQPACIAYYTKVVQALLGQPGYVGGPPLFCEAL